jgi:signal transduction histidine kinase
MQPDDPAQMHAAALHAQKLESIGQLAAGIAHEMNTPIQWVGDNTRFLKESFAILMDVIAHCQRVIDAAAQHTLTDEIVQEAVAAIRQADLEYLSVDVPKAIDQSLEGIDRVARIVRAMKEFSHPDKAQKVPTDIHKCIETTITVARNEWKYVAVVAKLFDPGLPTVTCIPGDFNQVILNLIVNAAHAIGDRVGDGSSGKGIITISTKADGDWVEVRVTDTGTGIPQAIRERIFDPFFTTKEVGKGTGQGLAIAHAVIIKKHGGTIAYETEENVGTTFIVRLPVAATDSVEEDLSCAETALVRG